MKTLKTLTILAAATLALSACSSPEPVQESKQTNQEAASTQQATPELVHDALSHGQYAVNDAYGARIKFDLPASADHPAVAEIEALRAEAGQPEAHYVVIEVDNRQGTQDVHMGSLSVFDADGAEYTTTAASYAINNWIVDDEGYALSDDLLTKSNDLTADLSLTVPPAGKGELIRVFESPELPDSFTRVATYPYPMEQEDAHPVSSTQ